MGNITKSLLNLHLSSLLVHYIKVSMISFAIETLNFSENPKILENETIKHNTINQEAERLMKEYGNNILRISYSYLHNLSDAEDILQDTLIQYLKKTPHFENASHEKAWLLRVASNLSKNKIEYNVIRSSDELNDRLVSEEKEDLSYIWDAVKSLPIQYREVIHLYYYEGYSTSDISKIINRKESTVRSDLRRGRERLKKILREAYDFE